MRRGIFSAASGPSPSRHRGDQEQAADAQERHGDDEQARDRAAAQRRLERAVERGARRVAAVRTFVRIAIHMPT
jgi:hypothetical protein